MNGFFLFVAGVNRLQHQQYHRRVKCLSERFFRQAETFAKPSDVDAVQGVAAQRVQTYQVDRQASEQHTTQKCATDGGFAKVSKDVSEKPYYPATFETFIIFKMPV